MTTDRESPALPTTPTPLVRLAPLGIRSAPAGWRSATSSPPLATRRLPATVRHPISATPTWRNAGDICMDCGVLSRGGMRRIQSNGKRWHRTPTGDLVELRACSASPQRDPSVREGATPGAPTSGRCLVARRHAEHSSQTQAARPAGGPSRPDPSATRPLTAGAEHSTRLPSSGGST